MKIGLVTTNAIALIFSSGAAAQTANEETAVLRGAGDDLGSLGLRFNDQRSFYTEARVSF